MDEDTLQRSLRSRPPADPVYRPSLTDPRATIAREGSTRQGRVHPHQPTLHTRFQTMNTTLKIAVVAVLALAVGIGVVQLRPDTNNVGSDPSPSASPTPTPVRLLDGPLPAGTYVVMPFAAPGSDACFSPPQPGCSEAIPDDDIRITLTVPDGLEGIGGLDVGLSLEVRNTPEFGEVLFERGAWLLTDPCQNGKDPDIPVGPTAADFADALAAHPLLDVTTPVDVTLAGYTGKYLELQVPLDITACDVYRPWEPGNFSRRPGERWLLWILDVDGLRVVVREMVHEGTTPELLAQLQGVIDSIAIEPATAPPASPSPGPLAWSPASLEQDWPAPVRAEPVGDPVIVPLAGGYTDPSGDIESSDVPWIDIRSVTAGSGPGGVWVDAVAIPPRLASPDGPRIAYGLVFDTDLDGVADVRLGMDRAPAGLTPWGGTPEDRTDVRAWRTDLRAGTTEYGHAGNTICDCSFPGMSSTGRGTAYIYPHQAIPGLFYAWASMIQDGRVVATDYAPSSGWLDSTGSIPGGGDGLRTPAASPSQ